METDEDVQAETAMDDVIRAKWSMDGATTLKQAAEQLRGYAQHLESLSEQGWELTGPIDDDYGFIALT